MERSRVDEGDPRAAGPLPWGRPHQAEACRRRPGDRDLDAGHPQREVVQALAPAAEEPAERAFPAERLNQLNFPLSHLDERHGGALSGHGSTVPFDEAQGGKGDRRLSTEIPNDDGQMRETGSRGHTTADGR